MYDNRKSLSSSGESSWADIWKDFISLKYKGHWIE